MLVPSKKSQRPSCAGTEERIDTPGAETSGLSWSEYGVGPADEKPAIAPPLVCGSHRDRSRRRGRRADRPEAELAEIVSRGDHRHDTGGGGSVDRLDDDVARGRDLRLAVREVDHVHPVLHGLLDRRRDLGRVAVEAEAVRRDRPDAVVAEVRARGDPGDRVLPLPVLGLGPEVARGDACDVRPVLGLDRVERPLGVAVLQAGRREGPGDDHLGGRVRASGPSGTRPAS